MDSIAVNWDSDLWVYNNKFRHTDYAKTFSGKVNSSKTISDPAPAMQGGLGYHPTLQDISAALYCCGSTYFMLVPKTDDLYAQKTGSSKTPINTQISVNYAHNTNPTNITGIGFGIAGVSVSINSDMFSDETSQTDTFTVYKP